MHTFSSALLFASCSHNRKLLEHTECLPWASPCSTAGDSSDDAFQYNVSWLWLRLRSKINCFRSWPPSLHTGSGVKHLRAAPMWINDPVLVRVRPLITVGVGVIGLESDPVYRRKNSSGTCSGQSNGSGRWPVDDDCWSSPRPWRPLPSASHDSLACFSTVLTSVGPGWLHRMEQPLAYGLKSPPNGRWENCTGRATAHFERLGTCGAWNKCIIQLFYQSNHV